MTKRPTLADVAAQAGVSRALASIVMRNVPGASDATRERVLAAATRLGYRPDARARLLRSSRSHLLGVVFDVDGPFHTEIVEAVYPAAAARGFDVTLSARGPRRTEDEAIYSLLDLGAEAILVLAPDSDPASLAELPAPIISVLQPQTDGRLSSAATDEAAGIGLAVEHLRGLGHRRLAHVDGGRAVGAEARRAAFQRLAADDGGPTLPGERPETVDGAAGSRYTPLVLPGGPSETDGMAAARTLLALQASRSPAELPSAVVVFNDDAALGLLHVLQTAGIEVPSELSVVGYDDSRLAALAHVSLTSVRQDPDALAAAAVEAAAGALDGRHLHTLVPPSLTVRSSTAPPAVGR